MIFCIKVNDLSSFYNSWHSTAKMSCIMYYRPGQIAGGNVRAHFKQLEINLNFETPTGKSCHPPCFFFVT